MKPNRFRFRAWDKSFKRFCAVPLDEYAIEMYYDRIATADTSEELITEYSDVVVMQSTGLEDKNGKEIFEGDIVRLEDPIEPNIREQLVGIVMWRGGSWMVTIDVEGEHIFDIHDYLMVIGNIYENPELLK